MLFVITAALACDPGLLATFPAPAAVPPAFKIVNTVGKLDGVRHLGAHVAFRSASPVSAWARMLAHPELQEEWHPKELGTERVDRIEGTDFYQRTRITVLGAITIHRQIIARIRWLKHTPAHLQTCWYAGDPAAWPEKIAPLDDGSTWQRRGLGAWDISQLPDGGSLVSYQVWMDADVVPPTVLTWALSRTVPTLLNAFDARAAALHAAGE